MLGTEASLKLTQSVRSQRGFSFRGAPGHLDNSSTAVLAVLRGAGLA